MAMSISTLSDALFENVLNKITEVEAIAGWADAFAIYFSEATAGGIPVDSQKVIGAKVAMRSAMNGLSAPGLGSKSIQNGISAFWIAATGQTSLFFSGTIPPALPPPFLDRIAPAIDIVAVLNVLPVVTAQVALDALATAIHPFNLGGSTTIPGAPPVLVPIE